MVTSLLLPVYNSVCVVLQGMLLQCTSLLCILQKLQVVFQVHLPLNIHTLWATVAEQANACKIHKIHTDQSEKGNL